MFYDSRRNFVASNYTEHLGLCQWEARDQVLRTDFNEDNAKIDTILSESHARAGMKLIREAVLEQDSTTYSCPLTNIDWSLYSVVCIDLQPICHSSAHLDVKLGSDSTDRMISSYEGEEDRSSAELWIFPLFLPEREVHIVSCGMLENVNLRTSMTYARLNLVEMSISKVESDPGMVPGSRIRVWGMR